MKFLRFLIFIILAIILIWWFMFFFTHFNEAIRLDALDYISK